MRQLISFSSALKNFIQIGSCHLHSISLVGVLFTGRFFLNDMTKLVMRTIFIFFCFFANYKYEQCSNKMHWNKKNILAILWCQCLSKQWHWCIWVQWKCVVTFLFKLSSREQLLFSCDLKFIFTLRFQLTVCIYYIICNYTISLRLRIIYHIIWVMLINFQSKIFLGINAKNKMDRTIILRSF